MRYGRRTARIDAARARRQIELLEEYRTRLVADVVTGKLDVREAAARLPHDSSEEEPMDEDGVIMDNMDGGPFEESRPTEREVTV